MQRNFLIFHTSGGISSRPAAFLFLIFVSTTSSSSWINCPSLISYWLLIIFIIDLSVTLGDFLSRFLKCSFHISIHSSGLAAFSLALNVFFLLLTLFTVCHVIWDCLSSTESLILLIWFWMYSICFFCNALISFWALTLVGFLLLHRVAIFTLSRFFLIANVSHGILCLVLSLVGMHSTAASMWTLMKFLYSSFGVSVLDISWGAQNLFLSVIVYLLLISLLLDKDQSYCVVLVVCVVFLHMLRYIFAVTVLWLEDTSSKEEY